MLAGAYTHSNFSVKKRERKKTQVVDSFNLFHAIA
jgi:hypothetical protein